MLNRQSRDQVALVRAEYIPTRIPDTLMLWQSTLRGITLANIETLDSFEAVSSPEDIVAEVTSYVQTAVNRIPYYYRLPIKFMACGIGLACYVFHWQSLVAMKPERRRRMVRRLYHMPLFSMLDKLVRATALLRYFDVVQLATTDGIRTTADYDAPASVEAP